MLRFLLLSLVCFSAAVLPSTAMDLCGSGKRITCVVDGDTLWWRGEKVRILELDAPEISRPECRAELAAGLRAQAALLDLVKHDDLQLDRHGFDRYGRTLASVLVNGRNVADVMIGEGVARAYADREIGWCR